ncbi:MAG: ATP-binding protein [Planctomycetota bacterium]
MSVGKKITLLFLLMLAAAITNLCVVFNYQNAQRHDANIVNVAGRQKMLAQKITKLALSIAKGNNRDRFYLKEAIHLYDASLDVLWHGGEAGSMGVFIPPAPADMDELFKINKELWERFKEKADVIARRGQNNNKFNSAISYVCLNDSKLVNACDAIIERFWSRFSYKALRLRVTFMVMLGFDICVFSLGCLLGLRIVRPIKALSKAAMEVGRGDLTKTIKISSSDEIGELGKAFNNMVANLETSRSELILAKDYTDTILSSMLNPLMVVDFEGTIKVVNQATLDLLGYTENELLGKPVGMIFKWKGEDASQKTRIQDLTKEGFIRNYKAKSGEHIPVGLYISIMRERTGKLLGYVCIARDMRQINKLVVDLEKAKAEIEEWSVTLEKKVEERTKELKQAKEQTEKLVEKLRKANGEIKSFAHIVSHDLRSPLVNLKGFSHELREAAGEIKRILKEASPRLADNHRFRVEALLKDDVPEALDFIDVSTSAMERLISHILTLSRIGNRTLSPVEINTNEFVKNKLKMYQYQIENKKVRVTVKELPVVVADESALDQIFGNIITNAINYLDPERPGEIEISGEPWEDAVLFRVKDNGRGIAEEDKRKVFEFFRRGKHANTVPGEGMGLPYVKALLERHRGEIWFESKEGIGTTFYFTLGVVK